MSAGTRLRYWWKELSGRRVGRVIRRTMCAAHVLRSGGRISLRYKVLKPDQQLGYVLVPRRGLAQNVSQALDFQGFLPPAGAECVPALCTWQAALFRRPFSEWLAEMKMQRRPRGRFLCSLRVQNNGEKETR